MGNGETAGLPTTIGSGDPKVGWIVAGLALVVEATAVLGLKLARNG